MKKLVLLFTLGPVLIAFMKDPGQSVSSNLTSQEEVTAVLEKFHSSFGNRDTATLRKMITSPGLYCGTYPDEYSDDRDFVLDYLMTDYFADTATVYTVTEREIQMSPDNNSAIAMELFIYPPRSKKYNTRCNTHLLKVNGNWLIDSFSMSLVISNWEMEKINNLN
jgi:hypothetical protein